MAELELEHPEQADAPLDHTAELLADAPLAQAELVFLELWRIRREMFADPGAVKVNVGQGNPAEQTVQGNRQDPYNGVVIYNPTPATLSIGFEAGTGYLAPATVPPFAWASFPERYTNLSIALLNPLDQQQAIANPVTVLRTRIPPAAGAGPFGAPRSSPTLAAANPGALLAIAGAGQASAIAANPARRELAVVNGQATGWITLALGPAIPAAWAGIPLAPNGGNWATSRYLGPVSILPHSGATNVSVAEV
jgi:hypothetical protein